MSVASLLLGLTGTVRLAELLQTRGAKTRGVEVRRLQIFEENKLTDVLLVAMVRRIKDAGRVSRV